MTRAHGARRRRQTVVVITDHCDNWRSLHEIGPCADDDDNLTYLSCIHVVVVEQATSDTGEAFGRVRVAAVVVGVVGIWKGEHDLCVWVV